VQTEEPSQFRLNPQAWVMIAVSLLALGLPIAGVMLFFVTARPKPAPTASPDPQLSRALEDISDKTLAPKTLESGDREAIRLQADNPAAFAQGVARLAASVGGSAMPAGSDAGPERLWVFIPEKRVPAFAEACRNGVQELEFPAVAENGTRVLIEIIVEKRAQ
jgi:hypothetical protein